MAVACEDETLKVFGTVSGQQIRTLSGHYGKILAMAVAYDDCQLFVATFAKIFVFDIHNGNLFDTLNCLNRQPVTSLKVLSFFVFFLHSLLFIHFGFLAKYYVV